MTDNTYNGWTGNGSRESAYATWRIMLEIVDDIVNVDPDGFRSRWDERPSVIDLAESLKEEVRELVCGEDYHAEQLVTQYALAFLDEVSWYEIAEHILADWPNEEPAH